MHETLAKELVELASMPPAASAMTYAPRRSIYTPIMELGPKRLWFAGSKLHNGSVYGPSGGCCEITGNCRRCQGLSKAS